VFYVDLAVSGLIFGCMYAVMAVGLTLVYGLLRILHIAHAAVFALGAYVMVVVANTSGSIAVGFLAAIIVAPVFGIAIYRLLYQPLLIYRPDVPMIASVGLLVLMQDAFRIVFGEQGVTFRNNPFSLWVYDIAGVTVNAVQIAIVVAAIVAFTGLHLFTTQTRVGVAWRATVSKPQIAASFGVDAIKVRYLTFALSSALAAVAGGLVALLDGFVDPRTGYVVSYKALAIIVLGGLGSVRGTLVASLVLGIVGILRHDLHRRVAQPRRDRVSGADCAVDGPPARLHRNAHHMSAYEISLISVIGINVMLAVSLNMISGFCGQISLGHGAFYGAGAYAAALVAVATHNLILALAAGAIVGSLLGIVVGFASLRVRSDFLAITTIGVNFLFTGFVRKQSWLGGEMGISAIPTSGLGASGNMALIIVFAIVTVALSLYINSSWMGFTFRAVSEDEDAATTLAIKASNYKLAAFGIGTALAGLAGGLYAYFTQFITVDAFDFIVSVMLLAMVVIGGIGSTWGVTAAAIILTRCRRRSGFSTIIGCWYSEVCWSW
jgi:ABC-type branched-subunit amino acid transport system permease subunit